MKIICAEYYSLANNHQDEPILFLKPETAIIRGGLPFFYPDFTNEIHCSIRMVCRICKLGRHIQPRFSHTYFDEIGVALDFSATDVLSDLSENSLPWETARAFDGSSAISHFITLDQVQDGHGFLYDLIKNGESMQQGSFTQMMQTMDALIARVSAFFTIKIGDLIMVDLSGDSFRVQVGDTVEASLDGKRMLRLAVK